jgi:2,6-dioxo-6-phenylhexa-3-enoate hydrolase
MSISEEATSKYIQIDEGGLKLRLHFNEAGTGPAVIMLHGGGPGATGWSNYSRNFEAFVDAGFRTILMDCPGFGKSDPLLVTEARSLVNSKATIGMMNALGIKSAHLIGNSLGGASTLTTAMDHPERVEKLILMGPAGLGKSLFVPQPTEGIKLLVNTYRNPTMESLKQMLAVFVYEPNAITEDLIQGRFGSMMRNDGLHLKNLIESFAAGTLPDLSPRLGQVKAKTLCTWGRDDRFLPLDQGLKLIAEVPDATLHVFSQCGHWAQWEHSDAFNRLVIDFIKH